MRRLRAHAGSYVNIFAARTGIQESIFGLWEQRYCGYASVRTHFYPVARTRVLPWTEFRMVQSRNDRGRRGARVGHGKAGPGNPEFCLSHRVNGLWREAAFDLGSGDTREHRRPFQQLQWMKDHSVSRDKSLRSQDILLFARWSEPFLRRLHTRYL
jgi:hypothetical protein